MAIKTVANIKRVSIKNFRKNVGTGSQQTWVGSKIFRVGRHD